MEQAHQELLATIFRRGYRKESRTVRFSHAELVNLARHFGIPTPDTPRELLFSILNRDPLPKAILDTETEGEEWIIRSAGRDAAEFALVPLHRLLPNPKRYNITIIETTQASSPRHTLTSRALLSKIRRHQLINTFLGVSACPLHGILEKPDNHPGSKSTGQLYLGQSRWGDRCLIPVQATPILDPIPTAITKSHIARCREKFPHLSCRPVAAQFTDTSRIAMFELCLDGTGAVKLADERHYEIVPSCEILFRSPAACDS